MHWHPCVYVVVCAYLCWFLFLFFSITSISKYAHTCICRTHMQVWACMCTGIHMHMCAYVCICMCICVYMHMFMSLCMSLDVCAYFNRYSCYDMPTDSAVDTHLNIDLSTMMP